MQTTIVPYITVKGAARAIDFYKQVFGAVEDAARYTEPGGRIGHAELTIAGARLMLSDEHPEIGVLSPETLGGSPMTLHVTVPDAGATIERAAAAGAVIQRAVQDQPYGERSGTIKDPFGHRWMIATPIEEVSKEELQRRVGDAYKIS
jgi:PhnB protein